MAQDTTSEAKAQQFTVRLHTVYLALIDTHTDCVGPLWGHLSMNNFIRQNFGCATSFNTLICWLFRDDLDKILQRHCKIMEV